MQNSTHHVVSLIERLGRIARGVQHSEGMKPAQWEALRFLSRANRYSRNPGALADFLTSTRGTVSQTLITLEKKGYVLRKINPGDGRGKHLELTDAGREAVERDPMRKIESAVAALGEDRVLAEKLKSILGELISDSGCKGFGVCEHCIHFCANAAAADINGPHRCGLSGDPLDHNEVVRICREHQEIAA